MGLKSFIIEQQLLQEGGRAIKGSQPMSQEDALNLSKIIAKKAPYKVALVGSAGKKPKDKLSGDVDMAIACSWDDCKKWASELGTLRELKGLGIISLGISHANALRQVDLIPTANLAFCEWAYWNDKNDLATGLKGSHRNELLFACAKHLLEEGRYILKLAEGLERRPDRSMVATTPKAVCNLLLGIDKPILSLSDAVDAFMSESFPKPDVRAEIVSTLFAGLTRKELTTDHPALERLQSFA